MPLIEKDADFEGMRVHYWEGGTGSPLLLIHGSGPGASTLGNWRLVLEPLAERYHVIAADLVGFGLSDRKPSPPYFDYDLWCRQAHFLVGLFGSDQVGILGHSLSGAIALRQASRDRRVARVMTTGSMGARMTPNDDTVRVWTFPADRDALRRTAECLVYDKSVITDEYLDNRMKVLSANDYEGYFGSMFSGPRQQYVDAAVLTDAELADIRCPVLLVHGRNDEPFPFEENSLVLAKKLPHADLIALGNCSHSPALEHPHKLLAAARAFFG